MIPLVSHPAAISGWEVAAAIGTIAGAVATAAAVIVALVTNRRDREAARGSIEAQNEGIDARQRREHELDLLLRLSEQLAIMVSMANMPQGAQASATAHGLSAALPHTANMPALVHRFDLRRDASATSEAAQEHYGPIGTTDALTSLARDEIAARIRELAHQ